MKQYKYKWTRSYSVAAQVAGEIFQAYADNEQIVQLARAKSHPLHDELNWDDSSAAHAHRLMQISEMRSSLQVEVISHDQKPTFVRAFVRKLDRTGYTPTLEATVEELDSEEKRCWREMTAFRARWKGLQFAKTVIEAIADKEQQVQRRGRKRHA